MAKESVKTLVIKYLR